MTYPWFGSLVVNLAGWFLAGWYWRTSVVQRRRARAAEQRAEALLPAAMETYVRRGETFDETADRIRGETQQRILDLCDEIDKEPVR